MLLALLALVETANAAGSSQSDASVSIVRGKPASIEDWPWQVALVLEKPSASTRQGFFCGGSVLSSRIVLTAAHCVDELTRGQRARLRVISGRTRLNSLQGQSSRVTAVRLPPKVGSKPRSGVRYFSRKFDVALLKLQGPIGAEPIRLAGKNERSAWEPGRVVWATGWGKSNPLSDQVPASLKKARLVVQPDSVCRMTDGGIFPRETMLCVGSAEGHSSPCSGDSGGPLVAWTSDGYRLVGATSGGERFCRGFVPTLYSRVSGDRLRTWLANTVEAMGGPGIVGLGGRPGAMPEWCRMPSVFGLKLREARTRLNRRGCRLGQVNVTRPGQLSALTRKYGPGTVIGYELFPGWFAPRDYRMDVLVTGRKP